MTDQTEGASSPADEGAIEVSRGQPWDAIAKLQERVADLEQRLAAVEKGTSFLNVQGMLRR